MVLNEKQRLSRCNNDKVREGFATLKMVRATVQQVNYRGALCLINVPELHRCSSVGSFQCLGVQSDVRFC